MQADNGRKALNMNDNNSRPVPKMRTIKETGAETGFPVYFIRQLVKQNKISYVMAGKKVLVNLDSFLDYLERGEQA